MNRLSLCSLCSAVWCAFLVAFATTGHAQLTSPAPTTPSLGIPAPTVDRTTPTLSADALVFGSAIDPKEYHVGAGDIFQVRFWTSNEVASVAVSPEQTLVLPRVGEFDVRGLTLQELKDTVMAKAFQVFRVGMERNRSQEKPLSITLLQPRRITVKVKGKVNAPDIYTLTSATRSDVAVDLANKLNSQSQVGLTPGEERQRRKERKEIQQLEPFFGTREEQPASQRYITISHTDGTMDRLDLVRYNALHDLASAPLLREGDVVTVPYRDLTRGSIGVYGAVQSPGDYEYVLGDSLKNFIRYAFGTTPEADLRRVELTRLLGVDGAFSTSTVDLAAIEAGQAVDVALRPGDRIVVRGTPAIQKAAVVHVRGEVGSPGIYPIIPGVSKLSELIHRAGGFRADAFLKGSTILRRGYEQRSTVGTEQELTEIIRLSNFGVFDTANFNRQMTTRNPTVVVNMEDLFLRGDSSADRALEDGDEIVVPMKPTTVYVSGFVNASGFVPFVPGAPTSYYVNAAGGYAEGAVKSKTRVIKAKTRSWVEPDETVVEPGDEIYVPKESDYSETYSIQQLGTWGSLSISIISLALTIYNTFRVR